MQIITSVKSNLALNVTFLFFVQYNMSFQRLPSQHGEVSVMCVSIIMVKNSTTVQIEDRRHFLWILFKRPTVFC